MKTYIKIITISLLSSQAFISNAQSKIDHKKMDAFWVSKDVVKVSNKVALMTAHFTIKSIGTPDAVISKEVRRERRSDKKVQTASNVISLGYPEWVISKPVRRIKG